MKCIKIKVIDNDKDFKDFYIKGKSETEIEEKLIDWYLECGSFETTLSMIEREMNVKIKQIKFEED